MKRLILIVFPLTLLALSGCTQPETYPVTGEECGPNDPVRSLDAGNCVTPIG